MAVTAKTYRSAIAKAFNKEIDFDSDTIKVALVNGYVFDQSAHDYFDDVSASQATGTGYTAGGITLGSKTVNAVTLGYNFDGADASWAASSITATGAVVYDATPGTDATRPLIVYIDFDGVQTSVAAAFSVTFNALGIFGFTVA